MTVHEILDLDNIVCQGEKVIGFISEVIGSVDAPLYLVQLYP